MISGRTAITLADFYRSLFWSTWFMRLIFIALALAAVLVVIGAMQRSFFDDDSLFLDDWGYFLAANVAWFGVLGYSYFRLSPQQRQVTYEIDDNQVVTRDAAGNTMIFPWTQVKSCREHKAGLAFALRPGSRWLNTNAFGPAALRELRQLIRAKLGDNARLRG